jgi:hypothetical protein
MFCWCGMNAAQAADHIILPVFIEQYAAIDAETTCGGIDLHGQVAPAGNTFALNNQGGFARVFIKQCFQTIGVQHGAFPLRLAGRLPCFKD